jgi:hypothetical protein
MYIYRERKTGNEIGQNLTFKIAARGLIWINTANLPVDRLADYRIISPKTLTIIFLFAHFRTSRTKFWWKFWYTFFRMLWFFITRFALDSANLKWFLRNLVCTYIGREKLGMKIGSIGNPRWPQADILRICLDNLFAHFGTYLQNKQKYRNFDWNFSICKKLKFFHRSFFYINETEKDCSLSSI